MRQLQKWWQSIWYYGIMMSGQYKIFPMWWRSLWTLIRNWFWWTSVCRFLMDITGARKFAMFPRCRSSFCHQWQTTWISAILREYQTDWYSLLFCLRRKGMKQKSWISIVFSFASQCRGKIALSVLCAIISVVAGLIPYWSVNQNITLFIVGSQVMSEVSK